MKIFDTIIKQWLLQLLVLWLIINTYDAVDFIYRSYLLGDLDIHAHIIDEIFERVITHNFQQPNTLYLIVLTLLAEVNYRFIFKRYNWYVFVGGILTTAAISVTVLMLFRIDQIKINLLGPFSVIAAYAFGYALLREFFHHRLYNLKIRANRSEIELQALKNQLNPHFLFNTLNYLYGTALQESASRTADGIEIMASMMRYIVSGMQETYTPLTAEIQFIQQYLHLQRLRIPSENTKLITINIQATDQPLNIAPMLLIPFIENAFKYGINNDEQDPINIIIIVTGKELHLEVSNAIVNDQRKVPGTKSGLKLTRKRLELLYPGKYEMQISADNKKFEVKLRLQLN